MTKYSFINKYQFKLLTIEGTLNNISIIEKTLFPLLYNFIILKDELPQNKPGLTSKKNLLFDLLPILKPEETFYDKDNFSDTTAYTNFYEYRIKTVQRIFGSQK